ncbi:hypothetical protein ASL14_16550 [Paenibacillus sp. IHB B 3084]|uniref:hypothetical protein n=1 Tax=Paenibacillus sp. IHB B 3084 TaxID=867076 RepID=UPI00072179E9|nr:hypothetical protein [Paenibacillus sp. IHB B 3084]ALP37564.1 hypothetical protein ASL14_16550 [Paenibacillus sp. IHB B 3084]
MMDLLGIPTDFPANGGMMSSQFLGELGPTYYEERKRDVIIKQSLRKLESLGVSVSVHSVTAS